MLLPAAVFIAAATVAAMLALRPDVPPLLIAHAFLAVAALPLMLGAILHFVPVLTRSGAPAAAVRAAPWLGLGAGLLALAGLAGALPRHVLLVAATLAAIAALTVGGWIVRRLRRTLGTPHPGARWYPVALALLLLGMVAVFGMLLDTAHYDAWRRLHQHLNLFGWITLTALGTLPVLLPTAVRGADAGAAPRLRRDLLPAAFAALGLALGAAAGWPFVAAGAALLLAAVAARNLLAWRACFAGRGIGDGVPAALALATAFLVVLLLAGAVHGFGLLPATRLLPAFIYGFLLTLVTAALAQLLPVWRFSGPQTPRREAFRLGLARHARGRGALFVLAGSLQLAGGAVAPWVALAGLVAFVVALAGHWRPRPA